MSYQIPIVHPLHLLLDESRLVHTSWSPIKANFEVYSSRYRVLNYSEKYNSTEYYSVNFFSKQYRYKYLAKYYVKDHRAGGRTGLGNVRVTVDEDGNAIGWAASASRRMPGRSSNNANPNDVYKFTGHSLPGYLGEFDTEGKLDLIYTGARYMDPEIGRWLSVDPLTDKLDPNKNLYPSISPYVYSLNNPVRYADPNGLWVVIFQLTARSQVMTSGQASIGFALDEKGNLGIIATGSVGGGIGFGVQGGFEGTVHPLLTDIEQLEGIGGNAGAFLGVGSLIGGEINVATNIFDGDKSLIDELSTLGFSVPIPKLNGGVGFGTFVEVSLTKILKRGNKDKLIEMLTAFGILEEDATNVLETMFKARDLIQEKQAEDREKKQQKEEDKEIDESK